MFTETTQPSLNTELQIRQTDSSNLAEISNQQSTQTGQHSSWLGRTIRRFHPVQLLSSSGTVCGLGTGGVSGAVAYLAYTTGNYVIFGLGIASGVVGVAFAATSCISSIYLCAWRPLKKLEEMTENVRQATDSIQNQEKKLTRSISQLNLANQRLEEQLQTERQLHSEANKVINDKALEIEHLTQRLELINQSLSKAKDIAAEWKNSANMITEQVSYFKTNTLDHEVQEIAAQVSNISIIQDDLEQDAGNLHEFAESMRELSSSWNSMVEKLNGVLQGLFSDVSEKSKYIEDAQKEIAKLFKSNEDLNYNAMLLEMKLEVLQSAERELKNSELQLKDALTRLQQSVSLLEIPEIQDAIANYLNRQNIEQ